MKKLRLFEKTRNKRRIRKIKDKKDLKMAEKRFRRKKHRWKESGYSEKVTKKEKLDTNRGINIVEREKTRIEDKKKSKKDKRKKKRK